MDMQDVDFELVYEPGKDEADPLDFLSRHPLLETGDDSTEKMLRAIIQNEHAVVVDEIQRHVKEDKKMQKLRTRIEEEDWEHWRRDPDIAPYYSIKQELYVAEEMIFRMHQIVLPEALQRRAVKVAHKLGHLGITKTKNMLRNRYWFPGLGNLVEEILGSCMECKIATKQHTTEPLKMTEIPKVPWDVIQVDFGGPYPDGHLNLVAIDKRTRYPEVETVPSTSFKATREKMKKMFSVHGVPRIIESDNGPPFNSKDFADFAKEEGFTHHKVTPDHPRANGGAENFMKILNKTEQIAKYQNRNRKEALSEMLTGYRSTPHPATGVSPYEAMNDRKIRTKLDHTVPEEMRQKIDQGEIDMKDKMYKLKIKQQQQNRYTRPSPFMVGDYVLLKQKKKDKYSTTFEPNFYIVYRIDGSSVAARRWRDGREVFRDASQFKLVNNAIGSENDEPVNRVPETEFD